MEQIEIELVAHPDSRWSVNDDLERNEILARFPHSIVVATSFLEVDFADEWLAKTIGSRGKNWEFIFYYKEAYDFGYAEYFFLEADCLEMFKGELSKFYGVFPNGEKFRTNRLGDLILIEVDR
jgi:hypothetical protein